MRRILVTTLVSVFAIAACSGATVPTPSVPPATTATAAPTLGPTATATGSAFRPATALPGADARIAFELGAKLAMVESDRTRALELLPGFPGELYSVDWSADGSKLLFYQLIPHQESGVYETDASGSTPVRLERGCEHSQGQTGCLEDDWPTYSPDGSRIAVVRGKGTWDPVTEPRPTSTVVVVVDLATGVATELTSTQLPFGSGATAGENVKPRWSPDGTRLVFHRAHFDDEFLPITSELWVVGTDDSGLERITPAEMTAGDADWSPDGALIVFSTLPLFTWMESLDAVGPWRGQDIYTVRADGTGLSQLTNDLHSATPRWAPDGSGILFARLGTNAAGTENRTEFWLMGGDGSDPHAITNFNGCCPLYGDIQPLQAP
jgi:Tol biopolymer transport system component